MSAVRVYGSFHSNRELVFSIILSARNGQPAAPIQKLIRPPRGCGSEKPATSTQVIEPRVMLTHAMVAEVQNRTDRPFSRKYYESSRRNWNSPTPAMHQTTKNAKVGTYPASIKRSRRSRRGNQKDFAAEAVGGPPAGSSRSNDGCCFGVDSAPPGRQPRLLIFVCGSLSHRGSKRLHVPQTESRAAITASGLASGRCGVASPVGLR
jgi:hypothetical protein